PAVVWASVAFAVLSDDALEPDETIAFVEANQAHALCVAPLYGNLTHGGAYESAARADQHDLIVLLDLQRPDHAAIALGRLQRDDALSAASMHGKVFERRQLAVTVLRRRQDHARFVENDEGDDFLAFRQANAANPRGGTPHWAHVVFIEADCLAAARTQDDLLRSVGDIGGDEPIARLELDRDDARLTGARERFERCLLHGSRRGRHEHELVLLELVDRQHGIDALAFLERQQVHDRLAARAAACLRQLIHLEPIELSGAREAEQRVVGIGHEQFVDEVLVLDARRRFAAPAAPLRLIGGYRLRLRVAAVRQRNDHVLLLDQILDREIGV